MTRTEVQRSINVAREFNEVADYIAHVPNLPRWSRFFSEVYAPTVDGYNVMTTRGQGKTRISRTRRAGAIHLQIETEFVDLRETSWMMVEPNAFGSSVTFRVELPGNAPPTLSRAMVAAIELELSTLKRLVEVSDAGA